MRSLSNRACGREADRSADRIDVCLSHCGHLFAEDQPGIRQSNAPALRNRLMAPTVWKLHWRANSIA